ncbi:MAG TPA: hypothetical protein VK540_11760 [Polyangiaceae bacterium]|nr:hypothetical protein [Polyangiaceae bacterium]
MKRNSKNSRKASPLRSPKLPDELVPIVDAVVEVVFERLRSATAPPNTTKGPPLRRKTARLNLPLPKQRTALAEALADLLLADLGRRALAQKKAKTRASAAKPPSRRGVRPPKTRRARI